MEQIINDVLKYFTFFSYPPTADEIYSFLKKPIKKRHFLAVLKSMVKKGDITIYKSSNFKLQSSKSIKNLKFIIKNCNRYRVGEYSKKISNIKYQISKKHSKNQQQQSSNIAIEQYNNRTIEQLNNFSNRYQSSIKKLSGWRFRVYIKLLSLFPQIKLVGLSGSISMLNASEDDDIDLFVITANNRLFTGRAIALAMAQILGIRRTRDKASGKTRYQAPVPPSPFPVLYNKVCLNLFFDSSDLAVPKFKRTEYVAHEVLQMKPVINQSQTYEQFLKANSWVTNIFPNTAGLISKIKYQKSNIHIENQKNILFLIFMFNSLSLIFSIFPRLIEALLRKIELYFINKHTTSELISSTQLWFHPKDFGKQLQFT